MMADSIQIPSTFRHLSIPDGIRAAMSRNPNKIAMKHWDHERTYRSLVNRMDIITNGLMHDFNLSSKDHIAIVAGNSIEYMEIVLGASQAGIPIATINPKLSPLEIQAICDDAQAKVLFVDQASSASLLDCEYETIKNIIVIESQLEDWMKQSKPIANVPTVQEWDVFTMPYTSGTTGKPKGVLVPHRSRILTLFAMAVEYGCYSPDDRFLAIAPMCHGAGMIFSLAPIFFGGYAQIMDGFNPELIVKTFKSENITDLIIDLRYNGGGSVNTATYLGAMVTGQFNGQLFSKEQWNSKIQELLDASIFENNFTNEIIKRDQNQNIILQEPINSLNLNRVYFITTGSSASASELVMNSLSSYIDVSSVGKTTIGKVHGSVTLYDSDNYTRTGNNLANEHTWALQPLVLEILNKDNFNDPNGITPTVELAEDYENLGVLGERSDPLLDRTILLIATGGRSMNTRVNEFSELKQISNSKENYPSGNNMFIELKKKK